MENNTFDDETIENISFNENNILDTKIDDTENKVDLSKYTVIDHLDEDKELKVYGKVQKFVLISFLSPEGVMNCNMRAIKVRGVYETQDEAIAACKKLEEEDKYFQIFVGEVGKWLEFDPPADKVEREVSGNKNYQKILDAQRKQRMDKMNELCGKYKEQQDKKTKGKNDRKTENNKSAAAENNSVVTKKEDEPKPVKQSHGSTVEKIKERMRKRLAEKTAKNSNDMLTKTKEEKNENKKDPQNLQEKVEMVRNVSNSLESAKDKLTSTEKNIDKIKALMAKRRLESN